MANPKSARSSTPYFQEIIDLRQQGTNTTLELLESAALALERKDISAARKHIMTLISSKPKATPVNDISDKFFMHFMARLLFLNATKQFRLVFDWWTPFKWPTQPQFTRLRFVWDHIVEIAVSFKFRLKTDSFNNHFTILMRTLREMLIDFSKTKKTRERKLEFGTTLAGALQGHFTELILRVHQLFQDRLDSVVNELTRGKGEKSLQQLRKRFLELTKLLTESKASASLLEIEIETTKIRDKKTFGHYIDYYAPSGRSRRRSIEYTHYDPNGDDYTQPRMIKIGFTLRQRDEQFRFLAYMFGFAKDDNGKSVQESVDVGNSLKNMRGRFSIHDNDSWVRILVVVFRQYFAKLQSDGKPEKEAASEAWVQTTQLFKSYLSVFTEHAKFNIRDTGTNYLDTIFPRTITGRELHDCGVYAVRLSYIFSRFSQLVDKGLTRTNRISPSFQFVRLPLHVSLIVKISSGDALIFHNKDGWLLTADQRTDFEELWENTGADGEPRPGGPIPVKEEEFWAEISADLFIQGVDQPALVIDLLLTSLSRASLLRAKIWNTYQKQVVMEKGQLFSSRITKRRDPAYRFQLRYLGLLEETRKWYNRALVPFWNVEAQGAWDRHSKILAEKLSAVKTAPPDRFVVAEQDFSVARARYLVELVDGTKASRRGRRDGGLVLVRIKERPLNEIRKTINDGLDKFPGVLKKGVIRTSHRRLKIAHGTVKSVLDHMEEMMQSPDTLQKVPVPPFAEKASRLEVIPV